MTEKPPRPMYLVGGANRAGVGITWQGFQFPNTSFDPQTLAAALKHGATLYIGTDGSPFEFDEAQTLLGDIFPFDDTYRRDRLIGPTALCAHWFCFTGRQAYLNHCFPATFLRELITTCFGLDYSDIPMDAVLAGLVWQGFQVERLKAKGPTRFNWAANIRSIAYLSGSRPIQITRLGDRGAIPPIRISE